MAPIYRVTIEPAAKENSFRITWHKVGVGKINSFEGAAEVTLEEVRRLWYHSRYQLDIGRKLFCFLDGDSCHLQRALDEAGQKGESLHLHLHACKQVADWPFELLAKEDIFLLPHRLHLVRRVSDWGAARDLPPKNQQLKLLFMASSALDVEPELNFEREEEAIFHITEKLAIDMEVEDSGSMEGLKRQLEQEQYDVIHLSGHADIDEKGQPYFIMENETGHEHVVFPDDLWEGALIENPPRLLFLSGCRTGEAPGSGAVVSFARMLVGNHNLPVVLGWGRSVADEQAAHAEKVLYHELSRGKTIPDAVQRVRYELLKKYQSNSAPAWPMLRLFSSGMPLNSLVQKGQHWQPKPQRMKHIYLKNSRVQVLLEGFVGRRRQLQTSLRALRQDFDKVGVLLLGTAGLGKSCLAGKISERFNDYTLIIVHGKFNAITLRAALTDAFIISQDEKGKQILSQKEEMTKKLANLCRASFKEKNYLLLLDDFDKNLEGAEKGEPGRLLPEAADLLETLLHYLPFSGKTTQIIITSRYLFSITEQDRNLVKEKLEMVWLTSFQESEQRSKVRQLRHIFNYPDLSIVPKLAAAGHGNPRLMEWLDLLVGEMTPKETPQLLEAIENKKEEFIRNHVLQELVQRSGKKLERFLRHISIYRRPVLIRGIHQVAKKAGLKDWKKLLEKAVELSLVEFDQTLLLYQVTPLLKEKLLEGLETSQRFHKAAFAYYKQECENLETIEPILWEEWIYHALNCGEEEVASKQGGRLVKHLRERLAFWESRRVGEWIVNGKTRKLSTINDAYLLNELAFTIRDLGDHRQAIKYYIQALTIFKEVYGEKHPDVGTSLNNIGSSWEALDDYPQAIEYYEQALAIWKEVHGKKHPQIAAILNNLGVSWKALGDYRKAIEYFKQALVIWKKVYGEKHPQVAAGLNNLGLAWNALGDSNKALEHYEQALFIDRAIYGETHPDIATDLNNLGSAWDSIGEYQRAIEYFEQALSIDWEVYGEAHPNIATRLNNLGSALFALGQHRQAIEYYEQALSIDREIYGDNSPRVAVDLNNLGSVYFELGQKEQAKDYFEKAYEIFNQFFGSDHPHTKAVAQWLTA